MRKNKVIFFLPDLNGGGAERAVLNLLKSWSEWEGEKNAPILLLRGRTGAFSEEVPDGIQVIDLGLRRSGLMASICTSLKVAKLLRILSPSVVVSFLSHPSIAIAVWLSRTRCPLVASVQNPIRTAAKDFKWLTWQALLFRLRYWLIAQSFKNTALFLPISQGIGKELEGEFGIEKSRIVVVPNSVDLSLVGMSPPASTKSCPTNHDSTLPIVVTAGRLVKQKGIDILIEAVRQLRDSGRSVRLLILGEGEERLKLKSMVASYDLEALVSFEGFKKNPMAYFKKADIFVLASRYEGFGNVIIEALACGIPVIATNAPFGPSDILGDNKYGVLIPTERADLLASAIGDLLQDRDARTKLTLLGPARAKDFDRPIVFGQFHEALSRFLS